MNWKIIFQLSVFGLIMAFGTISLIPEQFEFVFWLVIFAFCGYVIARASRRRFFLHGFCISLVNSIWLTLVHILFYTSYAAHHPQVIKAVEALPMANHPRLLMVLMAPIYGCIFGLILGLFSFIASKIVKSKIAK